MPPVTTHRRSATASSTTSFRCCARARRACAHPLICTNLLDTKGPSAAFRSQTGARSATATRIHVLGLLVMQYPVGSPWERIFGWRFLDRGTQSNRTRGRCPAARCWSCSRTSDLRLDRALGAARSAHRSAARRPQSRHAGRTRARRRRTDRPRRSLRTLRIAYASLVRARRQAHGFAIAGFALLPLLARPEAREPRVLFVSNGHGEAAIADRIAHERADARADAGDRASRAGRRPALGRDARGRAATRDAQRRPDRDGKRCATSRATWLPDCSR